jgi:hypothetical protein
MPRILKVLWIIEFVAIVLIMVVIPQALVFTCFDTCPQSEEMTRILFGVMFNLPFIVILCIGFLLWVGTLFHLKSISYRGGRIVTIVSLPIVVAVVVVLAAIDVRQIGLLTSEDQITPWISALRLLFFVASLWPLATALAVLAGSSGSHRI